MGIKQYSMRALLKSIALAATTAVSFAEPVPADDLAELARLVQAESVQYVTQRNMLLEQHPEPWDISTAVAQSWELGLAAYILNQRSLEKRAFEMLDMERPSSYRNVNGYGRLTGWPNANMAFLLEKMWKAPRKPQDVRWQVSPEKDRQYAYNTLLQARWSLPLGDTTLWESMWRNCEDDQLRFIVLRPLCGAPDPSVQPIILEVLHHPDPEAYPYGKSRCLGGLVHRDTEQTVDAILGAWEVLSSNRGKWVGQALGALSPNSSPRARRFMYEFILDDKQPENLRAETLAKLSNRPFPDDAEVLRKFLESSVSVKQKTDALRWLQKWPLDYVRPVLRKVLAESDDPKMISAAALALNMAYGSAKRADPTAKSEDAALLESVLQARDNLSNATRIHIGMYIQGLRAQPGDPRPRLPDPKPDR